MTQPTLKAVQDYLASIDPLVTGVIGTATTAKDAAAADAAQTALDRAATAADVLLTSADVVLTHAARDEAVANGKGTYVTSLINFLYRSAGAGNPVDATWENFGAAQSITLPYDARIKTTGLLTYNLVPSGSATSLVQVRALIDGAVVSLESYLSWKRPPGPASGASDASASDYFAFVTSAALSAGAHTVQFQVYHGTGARFYYNTGGQAQGIHSVLIETIAGQL